LFRDDFGPLSTTLPFTFFLIKDCFGFQVGSLFQDGFSPAITHVIGRDITDALMTAMGIIPVHKPSDLVFQ